MRILIFNIYFHPDPTGTGLVMGELARDLAAMGHQVCVVTTVPHYGLDAVPDAYRGRLIVDECWEGVRVLRTGLSTRRRKGILSRISTYLRYTCLGTLAGLKADRPDVVVCVWPPVTTGLAAGLVAWWRRAALVVNIQDVYPDAVFRGRLVPRVVRTFERFILRRAARITVLSEGLRHDILSRGARADRVDVIPMWTDVDGIRPGERLNAFRHRNGFDSSFLVLYSGNLGTFSGLAVALDAAALLIDEPRVKFIIVGRGHAKAQLVERARSAALPNLSFMDTRPRAELAEMLAAADLSLVTLDPRIAVTSVPSKAFTIMASGRPVVAAMSPENEIAKITIRVGCGWCVPPDDPATLAGVIRSAIDCPEFLSEMGRRGRAYVERHHRREPLTRRHEQTLRQAVAERE